MRNYYSHFGFTESEMGQFLYDTKSFIAGGFALNAFLGERLYPNSDLDIFVRIPYEFREDYNCKFQSGFLPYEELVKFKIQTILTNKGYRQEFGNKDKNEIEYHQCALSHYIKNILNYKMIKFCEGEGEGEDEGEDEDTKIKIQIIILYDCSIADFMNTFDLSICRIVLVGEFGNVDFYHNHSKYLSIPELSDIKNKIMKVYNPLYPSNLER
jgi:hypothetical protein